MRLLCLLLILLSMNSCSSKKKIERTGTITIIKQWHLSPGVQTTDINASTRLPQAINQKDIYQSLEKIIQKNINLTLVVEGCETGEEINEKFSKYYNGWNYESLRNISNQENYVDVLTMLPLKIKAKYPEKINAICSDSEELMRNNQLAISDAKGFIGFYARLKQTELMDEKKFTIYHKALEESQNNITIPYPIQFTKDKTLDSLIRFKRMIEARNDLFIKTLKDNLELNPVIIIGGLHAKDLIEKIERENIKYQVLVPEGYPSQNESLIEDLKKELK